MRAGATRIEAGDADLKALDEGKGWHGEGCRIASPLLVLPGTLDRQVIAPARYVATLTPPPPPGRPSRA
jgi:hypothetical protein